MASVSEKLQELNNADLSKLRSKLDGLRKDLEQALTQQAKSSTTNPTASNVTAAAQYAGLSVDEFLKLLEEARKRT